MEVLDQRYTGWLDGARQGPTHRAHHSEVKSRDSYEQTLFQDQRRFNRAYNQGVDDFVGQLVGRLPQLLETIHDELREGRREALEKELDERHRKKTN